MERITATELTRNFRQILDNLALNGEEIVIERNHRQVARLLPSPGTQTALEAMSDLYRTLPEDAAADWLKDSRAAEHGDLNEGVRNPWAS